MILGLNLYFGKIRHDIKILFFNKKRIKLNPKGIDPDIYEKKKTKKISNITGN